MIESVDGGGVLVGAVLHQAEVPPTLIPVGFELLGLGVELDGERQILLVAGGCGAGGQIVKLGGRLLGRGGYMRLGEHGNQREKEKAA